MENKFYLDLEGSGLELLHVSDVLDYLGKRTNKNLYAYMIKWFIWFLEFELSEISCTSKKD